MKLTINSDIGFTYIKQKPLQSSALSAEQLIRVENETVIEIASVDQSLHQGHYKLEITKVNDWTIKTTAYIYAGHVDEPTQDNRASAASYKSIAREAKECLKHYEGCRLDSYRCSEGVWTIGYGSTLGIGPNMRISQERADSLLQHDLTRFVECIQHNVRVLITQNQFDAMVSFAFNVGCGAFIDSTLLRKLNTNDYVGAANEFKRWHSGHTPGLIARRKSEERLFTGEDKTFKPYN